ncbi:MAG: amidohydrolase family protein, partial [Polyangiaceae bacterium]
TVIDTKGIISPGLIDTHNHILFDIFDDDDWLPLHTYTNHDDWTAEARYGAMLDVKQCLADDSQGKPAWCDSTPYGTAAGSLRCEMDKYGELKGLVSGTTSIVGLPGTSSGCFSSLARSIDVAQNGLGGDIVQTSAIFPPSKSSADSVCDNIDAGTTDAYLIHCGEGNDAKTMAEFAKLGTVTTMQGCLYVSQTTVTHGVAFSGSDFALMADAGMKLTWSPQSNVTLYDATADIPTALDAGVRIALGPDWSMGGSQNMLDELRFAKAWSDAHWGGLLSARDLLTMATVNGASVVARSEIGRVQVGAIADLAVFSGDRANPYDAILADRPSDVRLVMVGGTVLYGDSVLQQAGPTLPGCETIDICGRSKFLCVATTSSASKLDQTLATIESNLSAALTTADSLTPSDGFDFSPLTPLVKCP